MLFLDVTFPCHLNPKLLFSFPVPGLFDRPFLVLPPYYFLRPVSLPVLFSRECLLVPPHPTKLALTLPSPRGMPLLA